MSKDKLNDFIDQLNDERQPDENEYTAESEELKELYATARLVKSLKDPVMPDASFENKLVQNVTGLSKQTKRPRRKNRFAFAGIASVVAAAVIMLSILLPLSIGNIVSAMEKAFQDVKAYHGTIQIQVTNEAGKTSNEAEVEVWADQNGNYFVKDSKGGVITVNNGERKWQVKPNEKQVHLFPTFPDTYQFTFELGNEIKEATNAISTKELGEDIVAGRSATIVEVTPNGGEPYKIWIDAETKLPVKKETAMQHALQYSFVYTSLDITEEIPSNLLAYEVPEGFAVIDSNPEQLVYTTEEAETVVGFAPTILDTDATVFILNKMAVLQNENLVKSYYSNGNDVQIIFIQGNATEHFTPDRTAMLGKIDGHDVEIQSPVQADTGILGAGVLYSGMTNYHSLRWQQNGFEFAVIGDAALSDLALFTNQLALGAFEMPTNAVGFTPAVDVAVDLTVEENTQKDVDAGSSPWKLDPIYVAQVFVSLEISPTGISGDYPVTLEELQSIHQSASEAIVEVNSDATTITKVYLKRLFREDATGIWTVIGFDQK